MRAVWKHSLDVRDGYQRVVMPEGSQIVKVAQQGASPTIWFEVDPAAPPEVRQFVIVGTGHDVPEGACHAGSTFDGPFVWHVYEGAMS